jgi:hypothetical protein
MGINARVQVERVFDGLRADVDWLREAASDAQRAALQGLTLRQARLAGTKWVNDPNERVKRQDQMQAWLETR